MSVVAKIDAWRRAPSGPSKGEIIAGRYVIDRRLARGGMSSVYLAHRIETGQPVAIKFLRSTAGSDGVARQRFRREAQVLSHLSHPNCVGLIDAGHAGDAYVVMEYVDGKTLTEVLKSGPLPLARAAHIIAQVLSALEHAHGFGFVHRDVKPGNIMVEHGGQVRLLDFGLTKLRQDRSLTGVGLAVGTPPYMAPEHLAGFGLTPAADIYATGVLLFELLTGSHPFAHCKNMRELRLAKKKTVPPKLADAEGSGSFPSPLEEVVSRAMARNPKDRFSSAREFREALAAIATIPELAPEKRKATRNSLSQLLAGLDPDITGPVARKTTPVKSRPKLSLVPPSLDTPRPVANSGLISLDTIEVLTGEARRKAPGRDRAHALETAPRPKGRRGRSLPSTSTLLAFLVAFGLSFATVRYWSSVSPLLRAAVAVTSDNFNDAKRSVSQALEALWPKEERAQTGADPPVPQPAAAKVTPPTEREPGPTLGEPSTETVTAPTVDSELARIDELVQRSRHREAIDSLRDLQPIYPQEAAVPYLLGNLLFAEKEWTAGAEAYARALEGDYSYREDGRLIDNLIEALAGRRSSAEASRLLVGKVGRAGLARVRRAIKRHKNPQVRKKARRIAGEIARKPAKKVRKQNKQSKRTAKLSTRRTKAVKPRTKRKATKSRSKRKATKSRSKRKATKSRSKRKATKSRSKRKATKSRSKRTATKSRSKRKATKSRSKRKATKSRSKRTGTAKKKKTPRSAKVSKRRKR